MKVITARKTKRDKLLKVKSAVRQGWRFSLENTTRLLTESSLEV